MVMGRLVCYETCLSKFLQSCSSPHESCLSPSFLSICEQATIMTIYLLKWACLSNEERQFPGNLFLKQVWHYWDLEGFDYFYFIIAAGEKTPVRLKKKINKQKFVTKPNYNFLGDAENYNSFRFKQMLGLGSWQHFSTAHSQLITRTSAGASRNADLPATIGM